MKSRIICSGALFYSIKTQRILLLQKTEGKHSGTWGLVGGTNEEGETVWQGLQREIQEEIGSIPSIIKTIPLETFVSNDCIFNFHTYLCAVADEFTPVLSKEHAGWAWCTLDQPPRPIHQGLKNSFTSKTVRAKLKTIFEVLAIL